MRNPDWWDKYLRTGLLPDGRKPVTLHIGEGGVFACFDPEAIQRHLHNKPIPWPGDPPTPDGYQTPWERV